MVTRTKKIFVGGLSAPSTLDDVKKYFEQFGRVSWKNPLEYGCFVNFNPLNIQKANIPICLCEAEFAIHSKVVTQLPNSESNTWVIKITRRGIQQRNFSQILSIREENATETQFFVLTDIRIQKTIDCYSLCRKMTFLFFTIWHLITLDCTS